MPDSRSLLRQSPIVEDLSEPRWQFDCEQCPFDTYGYEDIHQLAVEHVQTTGHTIHAFVQRWGTLKPGAMT